MKKQIKKVAKEKAPKKKATKKAAAKKQIEDFVDEEEAEPFEAQPKRLNQQSDTDTETIEEQQPEATFSETEHVEQNQHMQLSARDRERLEFKFGARINGDDLSGTRAEVIFKVSEKTGESQESLTVMLNDENVT